MGVFKKMTCQILVLSNNSRGDSSCINRITPITSSTSSVDWRGMEMRLILLTNRTNWSGSFEQSITLQFALPLPELKAGIRNEFPIPFFVSPEDK